MGKYYTLEWRQIGGTWTNYFFDKTMKYNSFEKLKNVAYQIIHSLEKVIEQIDMPEFRIKETEETNIKYYQL